MGEGGAGKRSQAPPSLLAGYLAAVCCLGLAGFIAAMTASPWAETFTRADVWPIVFLAFAALVGEARPLHITHGREQAGTLSTSAPFILALVPVGGVGIAVIVQAVASLTDDVLNRRDARKSAFNTAQYTLSLPGR
jgi:hypothetical protein